MLDATVVRVGQRLRWERMKVDALRETATRAERSEATALQISPELVVLRGPFAGLRFPRVSGYWGAFVPKLLGSYERELHPVVEALCSMPWSAVVNVGCADGYYAVGLALRTGAPVLAFDLDPEARRCCEELAAANGVGDLVSVGAGCDAATLPELPLGERALFVVDCEGCERQLVTEATRDLLAPHDLLVETHDHLDIEISPRLRALLEPTHVVTAISSVDALDRAQTYDDPELEGLDLRERWALLRERTNRTIWLHATPR